MQWFVVKALGGSADYVQHLITIARSVGLELTLDDFQEVSNEVPFLADLKPSGKYVLEDVHKIGGTTAVIHHLLELGYLDGDCMTVTGKTLAENVKSYPLLPEGQVGTIVLPTVLMAFCLENMRKLHSLLVKCYEFELIVARLALLFFP
ncbi:dihydroxy-acid dehydratase, chloroplastic-like [Hibiscus syriacus]|uniref:dihydroxy-acid dehydratase, chloroplastic-like n=1 Tax=Hibiscus syriacus TaxID=106335 RepID=UPI00192112E0|nr:dihydroxy-acid dehydratase, chloroplastic-like [Hibiscus syriacus]